MARNHKKIETKWREIWRKENVYEPDLKRAKNPFYNLMMFPYPSAEGLHIGNMYAFVGSDIYGRFMRMRGKDVFEPMGLDGFGIHSENYALKIGTHPMKQAKISEKRFYEQLDSIGNGFAWNEKLETYNPEYYKLTQWIFVQMFKYGLAYRKKAEVNWCPSCKTVLANEQVIEKSKIKNQNAKLQLKIQNEQNLKTERIGVCERCETEVVKKELEQWFFKIANYAERLLKDLGEIDPVRSKSPEATAGSPLANRTSNGIDWSEKVKIAQRNWIGRSEGALIKFPISNFQLPISIFTTRPDTIFGATFLVLNPKHEIISNLKSQISNLKEVENYIKNLPTSNLQLLTSKFGIELKGVKAVNPANGEEIPIWVSDYILAEYETGAIMAVPAHDQRDFEFAKKFNLPIKTVICPNYPAPTCPVLNEAYESKGYLVGSENFDGAPSEKAKAEITKWLAEKGLAKKKTTYRLRDWLISRQRYWGPPIPMIFCEKCEWQPVPEKDLPVKLPFIKNFKPLGTGESPLALVEKFYKTKCPKCGGRARRETDVSDNFLDSAWYHLRYPSVGMKNSKIKIQNDNAKSKNNKILEIPWNNNIVRKWCPVDMYIGGAEHSVLHLLYARFLTKVFYDWKLLDFQEPFKKFRAHGLIIKNGAKMSKSKGNVVNPDDYVKRFGADALRMYLIFLGPFEQGGDFRDEGIRGMTRLLERVWKLGQKFIFEKHKIQSANYKQNTKYKAQNLKLEKLLHQSIKKITEDIENLRYNTAISQLMILLNGFEKNQESPKQNKFAMGQAIIMNQEYFKIFFKLLAPFAPYISEELWQNLRKAKLYASIHKENWPEYDAKKIKEKTFELVVQINGKVRDTFEAEFGIMEEKAKELTFQREKIKKYLADKTPRKTIFVPNKLINIVI